jgi:hypothetical protein
MRADRVEVITDALRLIVKGHVRPIVHAIQRTWRVCFECVGWVEPCETHHADCRLTMGFAKAQPILRAD